MSYTRRILARITPIVLVMSILSAPGASASGVTTNTVTTQPDGGLVATVTWTYPSYELLGLGSNFAANSMVLTQRRAVFCSSARVLAESAPHMLDSAIMGCQTGAQGTPAPVDVVTTTGVGNTVTTTWTIPASIVAGFDPNYPFIGLAYLWKIDGNANNGTLLFTPQVSISQAMSIASVGGDASTAAPIRYSGPEFSGLSLKPALAGSAITLEGRKLDQISSITIGGKAADLSNATDNSVNIGLPAGLAPGVYDLIVTTANHGKLTHMSAIRIREELAPTSKTIRGSGIFTGEEFKELTSFSRSQNPDMNTVTCIVNSGSEGKSFMQARALCDRIASTNLNVKTTKFEARSTVKSSAIFARVVFSSVD